MKRLAHNTKLIMPLDPTKWPYNHNSNLVDPEPIWRDVQQFGTWPINKIRQVSVTSLALLTKMNLFDWLDEPTKEAVIAITEGRPVGNSELAVLTPEKLTSLADQANRNETARAAIDVLGLFQLAVTAITTGDLCGSPMSSRDKIQLMMWLGNKSLPDAKSHDMQEVVTRVDRGRKKASQLTDAELKSLTKQELLDLMEDKP